MFGRLAPDLRCVFERLAPDHRYMSDRLAPIIPPAISALKPHPHPLPTLFYHLTIAPFPTPKNLLPIHPRDHRPPRQISPRVRRPTTARTLLVILHAPHQMRID